MNKKLLSVIVPTFRKEGTIAENLKKIAQVLETTKYEYEIICVIDGKVDRTMAEAKKIESSKIKVFGYETNKGKGYAVRYGMARSRGDIVAFIDAGLELDPRGLLMGLEHFEWYGADIIVGSKRHPVSKVNYPWQRRIISIGYQLLVRFLFGLKVRDTQVGLKIFRREVLEKTLPRLLVKKYAFDIEMLAVANHLGFKRIYEAPVEIHYHFADLVHAATLKEIFLMLWDTLAVFYRLRILRYYNDSSHRRWRYDPELDFRINIG